MPKQEVYFEQQAGSKRVEVLKSYDQAYAHEAFRNMDQGALQRLWDVLKPEDTYEAADLPRLNQPGDVTGKAESFLWDELLEQAREQGSLLSFFVVNEADGPHLRNLYVSPDWPSAEVFAKERLASSRQQKD